MFCLFCFCINIFSIFINILLICNDKLYFVKYIYIVVCVYYFAIVYYQLTCIEYNIIIGWLYGSYYIGLHRPTSIIELNINIDQLLTGMIFWNHIETFMKQFISQCPESFHGRIVMHCRNIVNRVQIAHVKQPIAHVNDIFPIGNFALDIKCMNCIQSLWRLMYFKCFDTSGNISDIYRTKHWSSCVICAILNIDINVFRGFGRQFSWWIWIVHWLTFPIFQAI